MKFATFLLALFLLAACAMSMTTTTLTTTASLHPAKDRSDYELSTVSKNFVTSHLVPYWTQALCLMIHKPRHYGFASAFGFFVLTYVRDVFIFDWINCVASKVFPSFFLYENGALLMNSVRPGVDLNVLLYEDPVGAASLRNKKAKKVVMAIFEVAGILLSGASKVTIEAVLARARGGKAGGQSRGSIDLSDLWDWEALIDNLSRPARAGAAETPSADATEEERDQYTASLDFDAARAVLESFSTLRPADFLGRARSLALLWVDYLLPTELSWSTLFRMNALFGRLLVSVLPFRFFWFIPAFFNALGVFFKLASFTATLFHGKWTALPLAFFRLFYAFRALQALVYYNMGQASIFDARYARYYRKADRDLLASRKGGKPSAASRARSSLAADRKAPSSASSSSSATAAGVPMLKSRRALVR